MPNRRKLNQAFVRIYRQEAFTEQNGKCRYCFEKVLYRNATAEHIKPKSKNGSDRKENIKMSCMPCNSLRGNMSDKEFKKSIKTFPSGKGRAWLMAWSRRRINVALDRLETKVMRACK